MENEPKTNEAFDRFHAFAKQVVTLPKAVIDVTRKIE